MARDRLLLDTSIVVHLLRGKETGKKIDQAYGLSQRADRPLISVVTVGETLGIANQRKWGADRVDALRTALAELVIVDINSRDVLERYAEIRAADRAGGWNLSHNDTWIAATASVTGATFLTTDRDFERLDSKFAQVVCISASTPDGITPTKMVDE